jgi:importin subunit beta-1
MPTEIVAVAISALYNCLGVMGRNFEREHERACVLKAVMDCTRQTQASVRRKSFECLVRIASTYYRYLSSSMERLFELTFHGIEKDEDEGVRHLSIEFWTTIAEIEAGIVQRRCANVGKEKADPGTDIQDISLNFIGKAAPVITPSLVNIIKRKDENYVPEEWCLIQAARILIRQFTMCIGNDMLKGVISYISSNIQSADESARDSSFATLGLVLKQPEGDREGRRNAEMFSAQLLPLVLKAVKEDRSKHVRDSASYALSVICEEMFSFLEDPRQLHPMMEVVYDGLLSPLESVAKNCCACIKCVCIFSGKMMVQYFDELFDQLMKVVERCLCCFIPV